MGHDLLCEYIFHQLELIIVYPECFYCNALIFCLNPLEYLFSFDFFPGFDDDLLLAVDDEVVSMDLELKGGVAINSFIPEVFLYKCILEDICQSRRPAH